MKVKILIVVFVCLVSPMRIYSEQMLELPPVMTPEDFQSPLVSPNGDLSLRQAIVLTLEHSPELASSAWDLRAREIDRIQAGLIPNPELTLELENFSGSGRLSGIDAVETTLSISQLIELGDKRIKRLQLASSEHDLAAWDFEMKRVNVLSQLALYFIDVLGYQENLQIARDTTELVDEVYNAVKKRVDAGKVAPMQAIKARVELSRVRLQQMKIERKLAIARHQLITSWGGRDVTFDRVTGNFYQITEMPDVDVIVKRISANPEIARWATEFSRHENAIALAHADTIPDISVSAGIRHFNEDDDFAAIASVSIPLFIFDDRQTRVDQSNVALNRAKTEQHLAESRIRAALMVAWQRLALIIGEVKTLQEEILPGAKSAFEAASKTYQLGKLDLLDLLDAQRTYFSTRQQHIDSIREYHAIRVAIERLVGASLDATDVSLLTGVKQ